MKGEDERLLVGAGVNSGGKDDHGALRSHSCALRSLVKRKGRQRRGAAEQGSAVSDAGQWRTGRGSRLGVLRDAVLCPQQPPRAEDQATVRRAQELLVHGECRRRPAAVVSSGDQAAVLGAEGQGVRTRPVPEAPTFDGNDVLTSVSWSRHACSH